MLARTLIDKINKPLIINDEKSNIKLSSYIGIILNNNDTAEETLYNADIVIKKAKELCTDTIQVYDKKMRIDKEKKVTLKTDILKGIENEEFELFYQPQINSKTKELVGLEGLVRWNHPEKGMIHPEYFINTAEKAGIINLLDRYLMKKALKHDLVKLREYGYKHKISLNLSPQQLSDNFLTFLNDIQTDGIKNDVKFEITETELMLNVNNSLKVLSELNQLSIELIIDDFGTGYSSLEYLDILPVSTIKIDKAFVNRIHTKDTKVIEAIINLAKSLNLNIIAEGVETNEQIKWLQDRECYNIQGWVYDKALNLDGVIYKYLKYRR
jgi:EAL domain-containing protein (putative c-di-GMP-specific phosphodiesterase class I)